MEDINALTATGDDVVFVAGADRDAGDSKAAVYRYSDGEFTRVFRSSREGSELYAVDEGGGFIWAAGYERISIDEVRPYAVRYHGTEWEEVPVPAEIPAREFNGVYAQRPDCVWFEVGGDVYLYRGTAWERVFATGDARGGDLTVTDAGRAFVLACNRSPQEWAVYVSDDEGASWAREVIPRTYGVFSLASHFIVPIAPAGNGLFIATTFYNAGENDIRYYGIIKRDDAPPGQGTYSLEFIAPHGPTFYGINTMAFRSPDDGYALGPMTSAALKDGAWTLEQMPDAMPSLEAAAASDNYYWAVLENADDYPDSLWRTP